MRETAATAAVTVQARGVAGGGAVLLLPVNWDRCDELVRRIELLREAGIGPVLDVRAP